MRGNLKLLGNVEQVCLCCTVFNFFITKLCSGMEKTFGTVCLTLLLLSFIFFLNPTVATEL